ncbi:MAG: preprotein translocase subunit YajC [Lachnospiraceae bacterium]|nr:preprotein translocase subunit YajC [Lachnospiraceae bacterium]
MLLNSGSAGNNLLVICAYVLIFGVIIYFMTIRPQKKQQAQADAMHASMQAGDSVLTTSGFYGVIIDIMDDTVIVEFGNNRNCRIPMTKDAIAAVEKPNLTKTAEEE